MAYTQHTYPHTSKALLQQTLQTSVLYVVLCCQLSCLLTAVTQLACRTHIPARGEWGQRSHLERHGGDVCQEDSVKGLCHSYVVSRSQSLVAQLTECESGKTTDALLHLLHRHDLVYARRRCKQNPSGQHAQSHPQAEPDVADALAEHDCRQTATSDLLRVLHQKAVARKWCSS